MADSSPPPSEAPPPASTVAATEEEEGTASLPLLARLLNHLLTPGSSLTPVVWVIFNIIMVFLIMIWLCFLYSFPSNLHVWVFGVLGLGLAVSTNWLLHLIFSAGLDFNTQEAEERKKNLAKKNE